MLRRWRLHHDDTARQTEGVVGLDQPAEVVEAFDHGYREAALGAVEARQLGAAVAYDRHAQGLQALQGARRVENRLDAAAHNDRAGARQLLQIG